MDSKKSKYGSFPGFVIVVLIGFIFYYLLHAIAGTGPALSYTSIITDITGDVSKQLAWFFMNFTEAQFYAGVFAGVAVIVGGFIAWVLALKNSRFAGFDVCYGSSSLFPWVLASQALSLALAIFVFRYINLFDVSGTTWVATFITVVGAPPSIMLLYGPSLSALLTGSILGGLLSAPIATWLAKTVVAPLEIPAVVANVLTMAFVGTVLCYLCRIAPWVKKKEVKPHRVSEPKKDNVYSARWFVRRCFAEFSEAQFYGNEIAGVAVLIGVTIDWLINSSLPVYGSGVLPAVILSQFVAAAVGVFLYAEKFDNGGWYGTYIPVVSVGPACVLMFGGTIPVALFAGILGGILGAPIAALFGERLPEGIHITNANVISMALSTIIVSVVMKYSGLF